MKICPKCGGKKFAVIAHITQEWLVNENGDYITNLTECDDVTHSPDDEDLWECYNCGFEAAGSEFNA